MAIKKAVHKVLLRYAWENGLALLMVLFLMLSVVAFDVIAPWPFKILIDNVLSVEPIEAGTFMAFLHSLFPARDVLGFFAVFLYFLTTFSLSIVEYLKSVFTKRAIKKITADFSKEAFKNLETLAIGFYNKQKIGDYIYRLGYDVSAIDELLEEGILPIITSTLYVGVTITIMLFINVNLAILSLAALPFLAFSLHIFNRRITRATKRSEHFNSVTFAFIEETLNHLKVIQAFSQEDKTSKAFDRRIETSLTSDSALFRLDFLLSLIVGTIIAISYSVVMLYGVRAVFDGALTTGLLIVFIFYLDNLTNPILSLVYALAATRQAYTKIMRMEDFFNQKSHLDYHAGPVKKLTGTDIVFDHVSVTGEEGKKILKNLSFTIEAGKTTVIFGGSGSGKTTLTNLIMRFIDQTSRGRILIGGTPIEEYDIEALRMSISYVPQEITLLDDTVRNNIVFGNKHHSWDRVYRAARRADAADFIRKLPGRYQFHVGEAGTFLSGGQRQRLMLARALMKEEADILIFDETFSALDVKSRRQVLNSVSEFAQHKTTLIISNIFDMIEAADNVIVLNHGKLLYSGPASRLPREVSLYKMIAENEPETNEDVQ